MTPATPTLSSQLHGTVLNLDEAELFQNCKRTVDVAVV